MSTTETTEPTLHTGTWVVEPAHSEVGFTVRHLGLSKVRGRFNRFTPTAEISDPTTASSVQASIDMSSVDTNNPDRDGHLQSGDFFNAETSPQMTFVSTSVTEDTLVGELTINGVTKPVVLDAKLNQKGDHPMANKPWAGFDATTTVLRSDFNLGMFAPYISDEVKIDISIEAMKAE